MDELQRRLEETENAMEKIMTQMNIIGDKLANTGLLQDLKRISMWSWSKDAMQQLWFTEDFRSLESGLE